MSSDWLLSIDFGTSNTAAAHSAAVSGAVETLSLSHTSHLMSSGVFVESPERIAVGDHAINEAQRNPSAYLPSPKRLIGPPTVEVNGYSLPTWVPVAAVLRSALSRAAAAHAGQLPAHLILTHPEAWSQPQVQVLIDAARSAGMPGDEITTISEPRAAASHYAKSKSLADDAKVAVFDFGGGTLDVAVLRKNPDQSFTVLAARGDNALGGKNFDALIRRWVDNQLEARNPDLRRFLRQDATIGVRFQLDESIRRAKELLSETPSATITAAGGGFHETLQISRDEFDELITPPLTVARQLTQATFADADITDGSQLAALYLTGGTSRIPLVHDILAPLGPIATLDDPKTVVAQGALSSYLTQHNSPARPVPDLAQAFGPQTRPEAPVRPGPNPQPSPGASPASTSRRTTLLAAGAAALVIAVVAAVVIVLTSGGSDSGSNTAASGAPSSSAPVTLSKSQDDVFAAMPDQLTSQLENCRQGLSTDNLGFTYSCTVKLDSSLLSGIDDTGKEVSITSAGIDVRASRSSLSNIKVSSSGTYVPGVDSNGGAALYPPDDSSGGGWSASYYNGTTGLQFGTSDFTSEANLRTFLSRAGVIK